MNSTHHHAGKAPGQRARGVLRIALACALALGAGLQAGAAWAQHGDRRDDQAAQPQERRSEHFRLPSLDRDPRGYDDPRRAQQQQQPAQGQYQQPPQSQQQQSQYQPPSQQGRISGRMTPDERRDLRRQINEAGMDLYPQRR